MPAPVTAGCIVGGILLLAAYVRHARRTVHPSIDLALVRIPTFFNGAVAGALFRVGVGATPFLLPLLLQLGFGLDPLQSGLLTCATAVGAMFMKTLTVAILKRWGFRKVLAMNGVLAALSVAACAWFTAATPHVVIVLVLLVSGCLRSLQFTSLQALSFADVTREGMSQATSITSMTQRLAQSLGIAVGAYALELSSVAQGHHAIVAADFPPAFIALGRRRAGGPFHRRLSGTAGRAGVGRCVGAPSGRHDGATRDLGPATANSRLRPHREALAMTPRPGVFTEVPNGRPDGKIRVAINFGNPVLAQKDQATGEPRGISPAIARELSRRTDLPLELTAFDAAARSSLRSPPPWDVAFLAVDPARAVEIDFTAPYVIIEGSYMVRADSALQKIDDVDRAGVRILVGAGAPTTCI